NLAQPCDLLGRQRARIDVWHEARVLQHEFTGMDHIVDRGPETEPGQCLTRLGKAALGPLAEREERLLAAEAFAVDRYLQNLVGCHEVRARLSRIFHEGA